MKLSQTGIMYEVVAGAPKINSYFILHLWALIPKFILLIIYNIIDTWLVHMHGSYNYDWM